MSDPLTKAERSLVEGWRSIAPDGSAGRIAALVDRLAARVRELEEIADANRIEVPAEYCNDMLAERFRAGLLRAAEIQAVRSGHLCDSRCQERGLGQTDHHVFPPPSWSDLDRGFLSGWKAGHKAHQVACRREAEGGEGDRD